ncbi:flavonoid 3'-monooxygenase-like [Nymphaea colorata]|nr:flavonoid 3'-monooxygenase-like [Nymphaea colorata]XP_049934486.1 flavonoid 3'-monooxygenase-like [Nymphaea colorata]
MAALDEGLWSWWWRTSNDRDAIARNVLTLLIPFLLLLLPWLLHSRSSARLPPGPPGWPLVGNLLSLKPNLHEHFTDLAGRYGPILRVYLGTKLAVVVSSPSLAEQVLKLHDKVFANRNPPAIAQRLSYGCVDIVWTSDGPTWRMLRRICVRELLGTTAMDTLYYLRRRDVRQVVADFSKKSGQPVNIGEHVFVAMIGTVTGMLWGDTAEEGEDLRKDGARFRRLIGDLMELLGRLNIGDALPALERLDLQSVNRDADTVFAYFDGIINSMIETRSKMVDKGKDFLGCLLRVKEEGDEKTALTMDQVKALLLDMVIGGTETTSSMVEWAMAEMLQKAETLKKAQKELEEVVGLDSIVEESDVPKLQYLKAVVKETLRLHPVLPLLVPHCPSSSCSVGDYVIPKGTTVFINVWAIHRDPAFWDNPLDFDPERFLREPHWDFTGKDFRYFPFGSGRRICVGMAMAERIVGYCLASLVHSFNWRVPEEEKLDLAQKLGTVMKKAVPLLAVPEPRLPKPEHYI